MEEIITVKITQSPNKSAWYVDKIGKEFKVLKTPTEGRFFILAEDENSYPRRLIDSKNCEIITKLLK